MQFKNFYSNIIEQTGSILGKNYIFGTQDYYKYNETTQKILLEFGIWRNTDNIFLSQEIIDPVKIDGWENIEENYVNYIEKEYQHEKDHYERKLKLAIEEWKKELKKYIKKKEIVEIKNEQKTKKIDKKYLDDIYISEDLLNSFIFK